VTLLRTVSRTLFPAILVLSVIPLLLTPTVSTQSLTTITSWTTTTSQVTSTSYTTFAAATTSITSMTTTTDSYSFTLPAQQQRRCFYDYVNGTFKAGERVVGKVTVDVDTIDFFVMSKNQLLEFSHGYCDQEVSAYVKAINVKSYVLDWVVPSDGEYDFVFFSYSSTGPKPQITGSFSVQYALSQLVASTLRSTASTTIMSATTETLSSAYYSTVQTFLGGSTFSIVLLVVAVFVALAVGFVVRASRRRARTTVAVKARTGKEEGKKFCINCGAGLAPNSKFCSKCGSAQS
jgi:ribosomal protein L40E